MTSAHHFVDISQNIFEFVNEVNFSKYLTSGASIWEQEQDNSNQNWVRYDFLNLALQAITVATWKPNFAW